MTFNLLVEPWIPVLRTNGRPARVGVREALTTAGAIRQIAASNPMDNVALLRFLLAVLMWCKPRLSDEERTQLDVAKGVPEEWLAERLGGASTPCEEFNLLGDGNRFFQDRSTPNNARPIGDLLVEFPTETKIARFRHVRDTQYGFCPACSALGVVRFCAFANAYGGGRYTSALNGPTPAYVISHRPTLVGTLLLHWPMNNPVKRSPPWLCADPPSESDLDLPTAFAWRSRRIWLNDPDADGDCAYCGHRSTLIRQLAFTGAWKPPFETKGQEKRFWEKDPHLIVVEKDREAPAEETAADDSDDAPHRDAKSSERRRTRTTLGFPSPGSRVAAHSRFWRRALRARIGHASGKNADDATAVIVAGPAANKGLYQDASEVRLPRLSNDDGTAASIDALAKAVDALSAVLKCSTRNPERQHPEHKAALDSLAPSLELGFREDTQALLIPSFSIDHATERLLPVVNTVLRATSAGSPLRRREGEARAREALNRVLHSVAAASGSPAKYQNEPSAGEQRAREHKRTRATESRRTNA